DPPCRGRRLRDCRDLSGVLLGGACCAFGCLVRGVGVGNELPSGPGASLPGSFLGGTCSALACLVCGAGVRNECSARAGGRGCGGRGCACRGVSDGGAEQG